MKKVHAFTIIPSPETFSRGGYIAPKVRSLVFSQVHSVLCASKKVTPDTDVQDEGFENGGDYIIF